MTHLERLKEENPGWSETQLNNAMEGKCPTKYVRTQCPPSVGGDCQKCWNLQEEEEDMTHAENSAYGPG